MQQERMNDNTILLLAYRVIFLRSTNKSNNIGFLKENKREKMPINS